MGAPGPALLHAIEIGLIYFDDARDPVVANT